MRCKTALVWISIRPRAVYHRIGADAGARPQAFVVSAGTFYVPAWHAGAAAAADSTNLSQTWLVWVAPAPRRRRLIQQRPSASLPDTPSGRTPFLSALSAISGPELLRNQAASPDAGANTLKVGPHRLAVRSNVWGPTFKVFAHSTRPLVPGRRAHVVSARPFR